jgi:ribosomal protein S18 acetylase RimI-like enzyme
MITTRSITLPHDTPAIMTLDTAFVTERIYRVQATADSFALVEEPVSPPIRKSFPLDGELDDDRMWQHGFVAEHEGAIVGFVAVRLEEWNRRAAIWHLYVAPQQRGAGVGRALVSLAATCAHDAGMRCLWLETSNVNYPAIQFYQSLGFVLCGLDQTLYDPAETPGETALYYALLLT